MADSHVPFQPLITQQIGMPNAEGNVSTLPETEAGSSMFGRMPIKEAQDVMDASAKSSAENLQMTKDSTGVLAQLVKQGEAGQGFMPHFLATLAALNGQFGPAIALQEQKRRTKLANQLIPVMFQANTLANSGKLEDSVDFLQKAAASVGDRAPEAGRVIQAAIERLNAKQVGWQNLNNFILLKEAQIPPDDPRQRGIKALKKIAESRTQFSAEMLSKAASDFEPHIQIMPGQGAISIDKLSGEVIRQSPLQQMFSEKDLEGTVGKTISGETGLPINDIINVMNGPNSPVKGIIQNRLSQLQGREAAFDIRGKAATTPQYNEAVIKALTDVGYSPQEAQSRAASGNYPGGIHEAARESSAQFSERLASAPIRAQLNEDKLAMQKAGLTFVNTDATSTSYGQEETALSVNDMKANPNYQPVRIKAYEEVVKPSILAMSGLEQAKNMYNMLSVKGIDGSQSYSRVDEGIRRFVENRFGVSMSETSPVAKVMEMIANRSIEQVQQTMKIDDATVGQLKRLVTGSFAEPVGANRAIDEMQKRLREQLNLTIKNNKADTGKLDQQSATQQQQRSYQVAEAAAKEFNVPVAVSKSVLNAESSGGLNTKHKEGDGWGPMQITHNRGKSGEASTADQISKLIGEPVDKILHDHDTNIIAGNAWLGYLLKKNGGDIKSTVRDYNGSGPQAEQYASDRMKDIKKIEDQQAVSKIAPAIPVSYTKVSPPTSTSTAVQDAAYRAQNNSNLVPNFSKAR